MSSEDREALPVTATEAVVAHYERQLAVHGATAQGMNWKDTASQRLRYEVLLDVCDCSGKSLHEVAAGAGHLLDLLGQRGVAVDYSGSDRSARMVAAARARHPGGVFERRDVLALPDRPSYDLVLGSGLFHVKLDTPSVQWQAFMEQAIASMYGACRYAVAFNAMSNRVDYRVPELHYTNVEQMLAFCRRLTPHVVLRHDYPLYEFSLYLYKDTPGV